MANEDVKFKRGLSTTIPETKVPGTVYITTDTGEMFVDDSDSSRIQINTQADWSTNSEADPSYVKNRTHWAEGESVNITWDGDTTGKTVVDANTNVYILKYPMKFLIMNY